MFYLSKRLNTLINRIAEREPSSAAPRESQLGFVVDAPEASEEIERLDGAIPRAIARKGAEFEYVLGSGMGRITGAETKAMEISKASVIEELSRSSEDLGIGS